MATSRVTLRLIKRKKQSLYQLDYSVDGRRIRQTVGPNKRDAELVRAKIQSDLLLGRFQIGTSAKASASLAAATVAFLKTKKNRIKSTSLTRYQNYFARLQSFFTSLFPPAAKNIRLIQPGYLEDFIENAINPQDPRERPWSEATVNDGIRAVKALFKFAEEQGYLDRNPAKSLKAIRERSRGKADFFSDDELARIWTTIDPHWVDPLKFIAETGLRKGELISLTWDRVNLNPGQEQITVESTDDFETKTGNSRSIPLTTTAIKIIEGRRGKHTTLVFTSKEGKEIHPDKIYHALKETLGKLGLQGDVHKLRHTYASRLNMKGFDTFSIMTLLGQTDQKTTQIYVHLSPAHLRDAVSKLESEADDTEGKAAEIPVG